MGFRSTDLAAAAERIAAAAEAAAEELNAQDGKLGDGDLGITVAKGWRAVAETELPEDLGKAFLVMSKTFQRVSSSSFGTLTATGLMAAAKATKGRETADWADISALLAASRDAMMARGQGALGQKSVLDAIDALAAALADQKDPAAMRDAADRTLAQTLDAFRDRPAGLGRARMFGEKSRGLDDPGMLAVRRLLDGLIGA
ncbi:MAG: DAK2 domain-containing protein [Pseudomonadota bacterium]